MCGFTSSIYVLPEVVSYRGKYCETSKYIEKFHNSKNLVQQWLNWLLIHSVVLWINGMWGWLAQFVGAQY